MMAMSIKELDFWGELWHWQRCKLEVTQCLI